MTALLVDAFSDMFQNYERPERRTIKAATGSFRADAGTSSTQLVPQFSIQHFLRPLYDKGPPSPARIGHHPDFLHLAHTEGTERHAITTMFMDLEGSTRLSRFLELEDVYRIKNAFIRAAIEVVHSFDGHVHRIMGMSQLNSTPLKTDRVCAVQFRQGLRSGNVTERAIHVSAFRMQHSSRNRAKRSISFRYAAVECSTAAHVPRPCRCQARQPATAHANTAAACAGSWSLSFSASGRRRGC